MEVNVVVVVVTVDKQLVERTTTVLADVWLDDDGDKDELDEDVNTECEEMTALDVVVITTEVVVVLYFGNDPIDVV